MDSGLAYLLIGHQEIKLVLPIRQVLLGKMPPAFIESLPICCRAELESQACGATSTAFCLSLPSRWIPGVLLDR